MVGEEGMGDGGAREERNREWVGRKDLVAYMKG